jgi:hypothetical protein
VRGSNLGASMSRYLVDRIAGLPNVEVLLETEVYALEGKGGLLETVAWRHRPSGRETRRPLRHLFLFIGADPNTGWLAKSDVELDQKGFIRTGRRLSAPATARSKRAAAAFSRSATSAPGSTKRVAAASAKALRSSRRRCTPILLQEATMADECVHIRRHPKRSPRARSVCRGVPRDRLAMGAPAPLSHLRPRRCCDSSPNRHATKHYNATEHPIIEGLRPARRAGGWCYIDEVSFDLGDQATPQRGPIPRWCEGREVVTV